MLVLLSFVLGSDGGCIPTFWFLRYTGAKNLLSFPRLTKNYIYIYIYGFNGSRTRTDDNRGV